MAESTMQNHEAVLLVEFKKDVGNFKQGQRLHARLSELMAAKVLQKDLRMLGTCQAGTPSELDPKTTGGEKAATLKTPAPGRGGK